MNVIILESPHHSRLLAFFSICQHLCVGVGGVGSIVERNSESTFVTVTLPHDLKFLLLQKQSHNFNERLLIRFLTE